MAAQEMYDYLTAVTAYYTALELSVNPSDIIVETGQKEQFVHRFADGQKGVVTMSSTSRFAVTLIWNIISAADHGTILDLWHNESKANGMAESFYWQHPRDGHTYTVKFLTPLQTAHRAGLSSTMDIYQVQLDVLGRKPA